MNILIKTLTMSIYPKITYNQLDDRLISKHRKPAPKLQTPGELKCLKTLMFEVNLHKHLTNIYSCWEFAFLNSTLLKLDPYFPEKFVLFA